MKTFLRPEHRIIAEALALMDHACLLANECWFGGGTAIVLKFGEYRHSLDIDFLCASAAGYRELRTAATERGLAAFFPETVKGLRDSGSINTGSGRFSSSKGSRSNSRSFAKRGLP
ncbi:nucleotidyl transferase AbiEii/AbiGii toxin family protein [Neorhizobium sp. DT-125]|uniref:nucleotidyl transferase AbiEii/AbiGii toxin family protein n=1 Tax=Neorhizobium sp. DT-125 TaxID=3396163 RepID=UPI003F1B27DC